jgi:glycosyltransferase involved in cell wall biosynthesis
MRIGYLAYTPMPSHKASGVNIMKMCNAFAELGHEVRLFNPRILAGVSASELASFYGISESISLCRLPRPRNRLKGLIRYAPSYRRAIQAFRPDLLYIRDHGAKVYIPCKLQTSKIFEAHLLHLENPHIQALETDPSLRQFVVISAALKDEYSHHYPHLADQLCVHHDGADPTLSHTRTRTTPTTMPTRKAGKVNAAYIGNLYPGKGMEIIQQLLPLADFCHFHIIGGQGAELEHWQQRCSSAENITFHGFHSPAAVEAMRSQFDCLLAPFQSQVMVGPSTNAAQWMSPLKIFEYMASRKPILASDLTVIREVLEHDVTALLCRPDSLSDWLAALSVVREEPERCAAIAERAWRLLCQEYSWRERARRILQTELLLH